MYKIKLYKVKERFIMKNEKRMDNNGFSLVELIIVIAIMAVLIGEIGRASCRDRVFITV